MIAEIRITRDDGTLIDHHRLATPANYATVVPAFLGFRDDGLLYRGFTFEWAIERAPEDDAVQREVEP